MKKIMMLTKVLLLLSSSVMISSKALAEFQFFSSIRKTIFGTKASVEAKENFKKVLLDMPDEKLKIEDFQEKVEEQKKFFKEYASKTRRERSRIFKSLDSKEKSELFKKYIHTLISASQDEKETNRILERGKLSQEEIDNLSTDEERMIYYKSRFLLDLSRKFGLMNKKKKENMFKILEEDKFVKLSMEGTKNDLMESGSRKERWTYGIVKHLRKVSPWLRGRIDKEMVKRFKTEGLGKIKQQREKPDMSGYEPLKIYKESLVKGLVNTYGFDENIARENIQNMINASLDAKGAAAKKRELAFFQTYLSMKNATDIEKFAFANLKNSGIIYRKFIQGILDNMEKVEGADRPNPESEVGKRIQVTEALSTVKSSLSPMDADKVKKVVGDMPISDIADIHFNFGGSEISKEKMDEIREKAKTKTQLIVGDMLGSASVGQVHKGTVLTGKKSDHLDEVLVEEKKVALKLQRDDIDFEEETAQLRTVTKGSQFDDVMETLIESIDGELNFDNEMRNLEMAKSIYQHPGEKKIRVVDHVNFPNQMVTDIKDLYSRKKKKNVNMVMMELVDLNERTGSPTIETIGKKDKKTVGKLLNQSGEKADKNKKKLIRKLKLRQLALLDLYKKYTEHGIMKTGFFHDDLHGGNILFKETDSSQCDIDCMNNIYHNIAKNPSDITNKSLALPYELTLIDFGGALTMPKEQQAAMVNLSAALKLNNHCAVVKELHILSELFETKRSASTEKKFQWKYNKHLGCQIDNMVISILKKKQEQQTPSIENLVNEMIINLSSDSNIKLNFPEEVTKYGMSLRRLQGEITTINGLLADLMGESVEQLVKSKKIINMDQLSEEIIGDSFSTFSVARKAGFLKLGRTFFEGAVSSVPKLRSCERIEESTRGMCKLEETPSEMSKEDHRQVHEELEDLANYDPIRCSNN